jgi:exopolysaccharide production protein ExoQ
MPPVVAVVACLGLVFYLLRVDSKQSEDTSWALWIPLAWMFFAGSRFPTAWLSIMGVPIGATNITDGSPIDRAVFFLLIAAGLMVLRSRSVDWKRILFGNKLIWLFFAFGVVSAVWSPSPELSLKRVPKAMGNVIMALVVLTDQRPFAALGTVFRRLAYLSLPLSIVFTKYLPWLGRAWHSSGAQMFTGVGTQKNSLGELCLMAGIYCVWMFLYHPTRKVKVFGRIPVEWLLGAMIVYLMSIADSATALVCLVVGISVLLLGRQPLITTPMRLVVVAFVGVMTVGILEVGLDISATVIEALGRRSDLTDRVPMWEEMLATAASDPLLGAGYEAYWQTDEARAITKKWLAVNAHNGYLDTYLSSGLIGLCLLVGGILAALPKVARHSKADMSGAVLRMSLLLIVVLYNWTESAYRSVANLWVLFFLAGVDAGTLSTLTVRQPLQAMAAAASARLRPRSKYHADTQIQPGQVWRRSSFRLDHAERGTPSLKSAPYRGRRLR